MRNGLTECAGSTQQRMISHGPRIVDDIFHVLLEDLCFVSRFPALSRKQAIEPFPQLRITRRPSFHVRLK